VTVELPKEHEPVTRNTFRFLVKKGKLRLAERRDGHCLLRSNLVGEAAAALWQRSIQLTQVEAVFRTLKGEWKVQPI
jgi:hypothetical protein